MALHRAGKPQQNAFIVSFNGRLRDEFLNETLFASLVHAPEALAIWRDDYNTIRPHSALGNLPPAVYPKTSDPAPPSQQGSNEDRTLPIGARDSAHWSYRKHCNYVQIRIYYNHSGSSGANFIFTFSDAMG
jgi:hypothetical protein